jgi:hypothetical protein
VPEILRHGHTGFIADDVPGMVAAIARVAELDPAVLRAEAVERFSVERMVDGYLEAYHAVAGFPLVPDRPQPVAA